MTLQLGEKIKFLRQKAGNTQLDLANAIGVTGQAVSRWELNAAYPDMELIPSIANYFGVTIDELFGYESEHGKKADEIIEKAAEFNIYARSDDEWVDECLSLLRRGAAEFPRNEKLLITLAEALSEAGWRRCGEYWYYDTEGYQRHNYDKHAENGYWSEAVRICEKLVKTAGDGEIYIRAARLLVLLYGNLGERDKALYFAGNMPDISNSREILLSSSADGKPKAEYTGKALLKLASEFSRLLIQGLITDIHVYESGMTAEKIQGLISLFYLVCEDGNFGEYHGEIIKLYLFLSRVQWEKGDCDEAFLSLDKALEHAKKLENILDGNEHMFTGVLVSLVKVKRGEYVDISSSLPEDWPFWRAPDYSEAERTIKEDPRWKEWVKRCIGGTIFSN